MAISYRENFFRTVKFQNPEYLITDIVFIKSMWAVYKKELEDVVLRHPTVFPGYVEGSVDFDDISFSYDEIDDNISTDAWGCKWHYPLKYMDGIVIGSPIPDMRRFGEYKRPASLVPALTDEQWDDEILRVNAEKRDGKIVRGGTEHGVLFLRHTYLRGFENAMEDYALYPENVRAIYDMLIGLNMELVEYNIRRGTDFMMFADDLGTQTASILSPQMFRKYLKPAYAKLMAPCKRNGILVGLHSDGYTLDILIDQIEAGVDVVNPQDLCNGIDNLQKMIKGKACIMLDIDRQKIIPYGTRKDIDDLIHEEIYKLGSPAGGLMLVCGLYPPTPPENVDALATAIEKYRDMWF